ncbi:MAG: undecaprenyl-diphosphate phosphatase [Verrucomicrobia bacterium]|nr:undecaprenyl-diphosphate phosphatase [Verrucomicrobiota bacterium]
MRYPWVILRLLLATWITGAAMAAPAKDAASAPAAELRTSHAIILGVIEGVTEFLPVSSTGHLIIASRVLGLDSPEPLFSRDGEPLWFRSPDSRQGGELLTVKLAFDTLVVVIQFGASAAVAILYWPQLLSIFLGVLGRDPAGRRLFINLMIAFVPAAGLGFLARDWIDENLLSVETVIVAQVLGALLMFYAEYWYGKHLLAGTRVERTELSVLGACGVGIMQCAALVPGTSRSMMTIVGGYFGGLDPRRAAEFSFLLGFVTLTAASLYMSYRGGAAMIQVFGWPQVLLGGVVAALVAAVCVRFLVHWLMRHGLAVFAWYRLATAAVLAAYFYL